MFRSLLINLANTPPLPPIPTLGDYIIVGPAEIDGDVRAGVYSILDKKNLTMVSDRAVGSTNVSAGYTIYWQSNNQNVTCSTGSYNEKMHLNINSQMSNQTVRISATLMLPGGDVETIYKDVVCTYAPADYVINSLSDWLDLKTAIADGTEANYYSGATTGCANKRFRLGCDLTFDYNSADYCIGRYHSTNKTGKFFGGVLDGGDYTITVSGTLFQQLSTDRPGSVFGLLRAARIVNLNVKGNISGSQGVGGFAGASQMKSSLERICCKVNVNASDGGASGIGAVGSYRSGVSNENISSAYKDILYCGHVKAKLTAGGLTYDTSRKIERCIVIGTIESVNTSNPVKSCSSLYDIIKTGNDELWARDLFQKANLVNGAGHLKGVIQVPLSTTIIGIDRVIDLNKTEQSPTLLASIFHQSSVSDKYSQVYRINKNSSTFTNSSWQHTNGIATTFDDLCNGDVFNGNSNWIKGDVGTPIINNQYATDDDVLSAAKIESYYGTN